MTSEETVKKFFRDCHSYFQKYLKEYWQIDTTDKLVFQIFRGVAPEGYNCDHHLMMFKKHNYIPKFCFDCYKISIEPRNVVGLFQLMLVFDKLDLKNDNVRKCMVETRSEISGTYKGFVYSHDLKEANELTNIIKKIVSQEISTDLSVALKRGCSEYPLVYPEYAKFKKNGKPVMRFKKKWQKFDNLPGNINLRDNLASGSQSFNPPGYTQDEAKAMITWLKYAATIEDLSYKKITDQPIRKLKDLKRPLFKSIK